jgi:tetratricopeptide (TPR) repeat protein
LDAERGGRFEDARGLYESLVRRPFAGVVGDLCRRRLHLIERGEHSVPSPEILNGWYQQALEKHQAGQADEAIALLCDVLASMPSHTTSWFFLGYLYARPEAGFDTAGGVMTIPRSIDEPRRERLDRAVQTLEIAARSVEGPDLRLESHRLLAACYLELGDTGKAVESASAVTELDKDSSESWANLSMAHLGNRAVEEAVQAAVTALQLDQRNEVARHVLATLQIRFGDPK